MQKRDMVQPSMGHPNKLKKENLNFMGNQMQKHIPYSNKHNNLFNHILLKAYSKLFRSSNELKVANVTQKDNKAEIKHMAAST